MSRKVERCIRLLLALQMRNQVTNKEMRDLLDCSDQDVRRDLQALEDAGIPIEACGSGPGTYYEIPDDWRHRGVHFSLGDALSLQFGRQMMGFLEGTMFPEWLEGLQQKLNIGANRQTLDGGSAFARKLVYVSEPYRMYGLHDDVLNDVVTALLSERELKVIYGSRGGRREYVLQPLALVVYRRALYLLAQASGKVLRLSLDRFEAVERGEAFAYPRNLDAGELLADSFGIYDQGREAEEVRMRFQPQVADLVLSRHWHASQRFEEREDGCLDLVLQTQGAELARLALEWGDKVEVVSPVGLRARVRAELTSALARYEGADDASTAREDPQAV